MLPTVNIYERFGPVLKNNNLIAVSRQINNTGFL